MKFRKSFGSYGCNLSCSFYQNYSISKEISSTVEKTPQENEPSIFYEFVLDTAKAAKDKELNNIVVTNGYIEEEPLKNLLSYIDEMNIDLKDNKEDTYRRFCDGGIAPVKRSIELASKSCHIEVTTLIVPGMNDQLPQLRELFQWLASVDHKIPLHFSRYFPRYQYHQPATDIDLIKTAKQEAEKHLSYVFLGNV